MNHLSSPTTSTTTPTSRFLLVLFILSTIGLESIPVYMAGIKANTFVYMSVCVSIILLRLPALTRYIHIAGRGKLFLFSIYVVFASASTLWSHTPADSLIHTVPLALTILTACAFCNVEPSYVRRTLVVVTLYVLVISWMLGIGVPGLGARIPPGWRLNGLIGHPQRLAIVASILLLIILVSECRFESMFRNSISRNIAILFIFITILATQTRAFSSYAVATVLILLIVLGDRRARRIGWSALVIAGLAWFGASDTINSLYERDGTNNETLSGRTTIWTQTVGLIDEKPIFGHGFASFESDLTSGFFANYVAPHAHNDALNILFESGAIGLMLLSSFIAWCAYDFFYRRSPYSGATVIFGIFSGLTGVAYGGKVSFPLVVLVFLLAQETYTTFSFLRSSERRMQYFPEAQRL